MSLVTLWVKPKGIMSPNLWISWIIDSVGHLGLVLELGLMVLANYPINLFMDLGWGMKGNAFRYLGVSGHVHLDAQYA